MPADNSIYETLDDWWDPRGRVAGLHAMNDARAGYFRDTLARVASRPVASLALLELGCGGGLLTEALARTGARVAAVDLARGALRAAARHAALGGTAPGAVPGYVQADAARLPFPDASFDAVVSSDLLEHVPDVAAVAREGARVLRPGGAFLFDTINRTVVTLVFHILVVQRWRRLVPPGTHDWRQFIRPGELARALAEAGLVPVEVRGLVPERPLRFAAHLLRHRPGVDAMPPFRIGRPTAGSYVGYAVKPA